MTKSVFTTMLGCFVLVGCGNKPGGQPGGNPALAAGGGGGAPKRAFQVRTAPVTARAVTYEISAVGNLVEENRFEIPSRVDGAVEKVSFSEGDRVTTGQELARIDTSRFELLAEQARGKGREAEAALRRAQATLADTARATTAAATTSRLDFDLAKVEYDRRAGLTKGNVISQEDRAQFEAKFQRAKAVFGDATGAARTRVELEEANVAAARDALATAKAGVALAEDDLAKSVARAPVAGAVQSRGVTPGQYVKAGAQVALMVQTDPLRLSFMVPESKAGRIGKDMKARFRTPAAGSREFTGDVYSVGDAADPTTREVTCWARVPNGDGALRPGYFASVKLAAESRAAAIVVPLASVMASEYGQIAYVVSDGVASRRTVKTGLQVTGDLIEVTDGLTVGDTLVVDGMESLIDGAPVTAGAPPAAVGGKKPAGEKSAEAGKGGAGRS